jgi:hypothetical protein
MPKYPVTPSRELQDIRYSEIQLKEKCKSYESENGENEYGTYGSNSNKEKYSYHLLPHAKSLCVELTLDE